MKIVIETPKDGDEDEVIIRCRELNDDLMELISRLRTDRIFITGHSEGMIKRLSPKDVYYFEAVDNKVFVYLEKDVYEVKEKLYEIEEHYRHTDLQRISKSVIVNISMIDHIAPLLGARLEASLKNGEKLIISRQYVPYLKKKLGISER